MLMKWLSGLLASISSIFIATADKTVEQAPLNTRPISYQETYYAPVVADLGNFPQIKQNTKTEAPAVTKPRPVAPPPPPSPSPAASAPQPVIAPPQDTYLVNPEPITSWLSMNLTLTGNSNEPENPRTLPEITFDREYWRIEVFSYWAPDVVPPKPDMQKDYFKLEIYEKGTNKLINTMTSGSEDFVHKFQTFGKAGTYYFKVYTKDPSKWELSFVVSPKLAK